MGIISYAQNFKDVLLWRAPGHVQQCAYIDIGTHNPIDDFVSKALYDQGWRGIHPEPLLIADMVPTQKQCEDIWRQCNNKMASVLGLCNACNETSYLQMQK